MTSKRKKRLRHQEPPLRDAVMTKKLLALAGVLNELELAEMNVRLKHGVVYTDHGYVLYLGNDRGGWVARTLVYTEFPDQEE